MKNILIIAWIVIMSLGCTKDDNSDIRLRISNVSPYDYKNIIVNTTTGNLIYGNLDSNKVSGYKVFDLAYRYAFVELEIDGTTYTLQPIDYVGETPLENGDYTYEIDASESQDRFGKLSLTLIEE